MEQFLFNFTKLLENNLMLGIIILLVIIPIYYKMGLLNWLMGREKNTDNSNKNKTNNDLFAEMSGLKAHFNHETTERLTAIENSMYKIETTLDNFEKFGIKIRKE